MSIAKFLGGSVGEFADKIGGVFDRFIQTKDEKAQFILDVLPIIQRRDPEIEETIHVELKTASDVIQAELAQSDKYTKRARPTIIYTGLAMYVLNAVIFPKLAVLAAFVSDPETQKIIIDACQPVDIPVSFATAWGGIVAIYAVGRTLEKRGIKNAAVEAMTGNGMGLMGLLRKKKN